MPDTGLPVRIHRNPFLVDGELHARMMTVLPFRGSILLRCRSFVWTLIILTVVQPLMQIFAEKVSCTRRNGLVLAILATQDPRTYEGLIPALPYKTLLFPSWSNFDVWPDLEDPHKAPSF